MPQESTENTQPNKHPDQPVEPNQSVKPLHIFEPYGQIAQAIAAQLARISGGDRQVESVYVHAPQYSVGIEGEAFVTETEREWWLVLEYGDLLQVTIREMDGTRTPLPYNVTLVYDRDEPSMADENVTSWAPPSSATDIES